MFKRLYANILPVIILALIVAGCSSSDTTVPFFQPDIKPVDTPTTGVESRETADSHHALWGVWAITYDLDKMEFTIVPERNLQGHFNITDMVIPPACDDCLEISANSFDPVTRIIDVDVTLRNPYSITGYDVRGILYTNDYGHLLTNALGWTKSFDVPGGQSLNPFKGFYTGPDPAAFGPHEERTENYLVYIPLPPAYNKITFAVSASWPARCKEPYGISFFSHDPLHDYVGATAQAQVSVFDWQDDVDGVTLVATEITGEAFSQFTYAAGPIWQIDVVNNEGAPPGEYEARIIATSTGSGETALYQYVTITIEEWDGPIVTGIDPDVAEPEDVLAGVTVTGEQFAGPGAYVKLMPESGPDIAAMNVVVQDANTITCDITIPQDAFVGPYGVEVTNGDSQAQAKDELFWVNCPMPYATSIDPEEAYVGDNLVDVTITGDEFWGTTGQVRLTMDGEPDIIATNVTIVDYNTISCDIDIPLGAKYGAYDVYVKNECGSSSHAENLFEVLPLGWVRTGFSTLDEQGRELATDKDGDCHVVGDTTDGAGFYKWYTSEGDIFLEVEWGDETNPVEALGIAFDAAGNIYIVGKFEGEVDFDPDPINVDMHTSMGGTDAFLVSLDSSGAFRWGLSWGGEWWDAAFDVAVTSTQVCVVGHFVGTVDFDPGTGVDEVTGNGSSDAFLSRFDFHGGFTGVGTWGSTGPDRVYSVATHNGDIYVTGFFEETVDFDPAFIHEELRTSKGWNDSYLSKFNSSGTFQWVAAWGSINEDQGWSVAADASGVYCSGLFSALTIFDPKSEDPMDAIPCNGERDIFASKFLHNGQYEWTSTFGSWGWDSPGGVSLDPTDGDLLLTGNFSYTVDFDPGPGTNEVTSAGLTDAFMCRLDSDGNLVRVSTWGGEGFDLVSYAAADEAGEFIFVTGNFMDTADFDPGPYSWPETSLGGYDFYVMRMTSSGTW